MGAPVKHVGCGVRKFGLSLACVACWAQARNRISLSHSVLHVKEPKTLVQGVPDSLASKVFAL